MIGKTLDNYVIERLLGSGGMGDVYAARDRRLDRPVALKVLPDRLRDDRDALERFEQEAKVVASFNHPNIVTLFEVEEFEGTRFVTMELVTGKSLKELIPRGGFPIQKLLDMALPLVDAVRAAHEAGITHRDLKPDNVMLNNEGRVKVLDFGLAKRTHTARRGRRKTDAPAPAPPSPKEVTEEGTILGTAAYMSPEQAEGRELDFRSDIFSLGVMLYEMATGVRPFRGDNPISVISSILKDRPRPITEIRRFLPLELWRIVRRCLQKDPLDRYQSTADLYLDLEELRTEVEAGLPVLTGMRAAQHTRHGAWIFRTSIALLGLLASGAVARVVYLEKARSEVAHALPAVGGTLEALTSDPGPEVHPAFWPDGKAVVYVATVDGSAHILLQRLGGTKAIDLTPDVPFDHMSPAFSPDGERIAFRSERDGGGIFTMGATGESVKRLTTLGHNPSWSPDGRSIAFASEYGGNPYGRRTISSLWVADSATGETRKIHDGDAVQPRWSPHGQRIAFWAIPGGGRSQRDLWTIPAEGGTPVAVTSDPALDWDPVWSPDGEWLYFTSDRGGTMNAWRVPIDERTGKTRGEPEPVTWGGPGMRGDITISADGKTLAYAESSIAMYIQKVPFDSARGIVTGPPVPVSRGAQTIFMTALSPDGEWLAYSSLGAQEDIFLSRADGTEARKLTDDRARDRGPRWSPDGRSLFFYSDRNGKYDVWTVNTDGTGLRAVPPLAGTIYAPLFSPDGKRFVGGTEDRARFAIYDAAAPEAAAAGTAIPEPPSPVARFVPWSWSPDGRRIAGTAEGKDQDSLGILVLDPAAGTWETWIDRGELPFFLRDGARIVYVDRGRVWIYDHRTREMQAILDLTPDQVPTAIPSRDERWLYILRASSDSDIWLLTLPQEK